MAPASLRMEIISILEGAGQKVFSANDRPSGREPTRDRLTST